MTYHNILGLNYNISMKGHTHYNKKRNNMVRCEMCLKTWKSKEDIPLTAIGYGFVVKYVRVCTFCKTDKHIIEIKDNS